MSFLPNELASTDSVSQKQHFSQQIFVQALTKFVIAAMV
jgi:hypothetical protein